VRERREEQEGASGGTGLKEGALLQYQPIDRLIQKGVRAVGATNKDEGA